MTKRKMKDIETLKYRVETRINEAKYTELQGILKQTIGMDMSSLLRHILHNRPIKTHTHDRSLDMVMEELSGIRGELKAIGVNINQITRFFNTYPEPQRKQYYAKMAFEHYKDIDKKVEQLLGIVSQLAKKWLQGST